MLLAVDAGNTNIVMAIFDGEKLIRDWRIRTDITATADELGMFVTYILSQVDLSPGQITRIVISNVVPPLKFILNRFCSSYFKAEPLWVDWRAFKNMPCRYSNPDQVGPDRVVNAVAGYHKYRTGIIIIDLGTATTFDAVSEAGEYLGGAICPGLNTALDALFKNAPSLPRIQPVEIPEKAIGTDSVKSLKSGIVFGYAGLIDGMVCRIRKEMGGEPKVIATGGLAVLMQNVSQTIESIEPDLTLHGLRIIADRSSVF